MYHIFSLILLLSFFCANAQNSQANDFIFKNVTYKITSTNDSVKLDIFQPTKKIHEKSPVVVFMHGGAWAKGDKNIEHLYYMRSLRDTLRSKGYAVIAINYRLVNKSINIADQLTDCNDALKWIINNARKYNLDTNNIGLCGESAGAHLALLMIYKTENNLPETAMNVNYVVDNFGPTDLNKVLKTRASFITKALYKLFLPELYDVREKLVHAITTYDINTQPEQAIQVAQEYSPIHFVENNKQTPVMMLHGSRDFIASFKHSKKLKKKLDNQGTENKLIKVKKGQHGFKNLSEENIQQLISEITFFIDSQRK